MGPSSVGSSFGVLWCREWTVMSTLMLTRECVHWASSDARLESCRVRRARPDAIPVRVALTDLVKLRGQSSA